MTEIDWSHNCLTTTVHHGRPEPIWNIPLHQASLMFGTRLKQIVIARIYRDALQVVKQGMDPYGIDTPGIEWAQRVRSCAEENYTSVFATKLKEIEEYYESSKWRRDVQDVIERIQHDTLNRGYQPLHAHDSINLLCRILGVECSLKVGSDSVKIPPS